MAMADEFKYRLFWIIGILCFLLLLFMLPRVFENASNQRPLHSQSKPDITHGSSPTTDSNLQLKNSDQNKRPNDGLPGEPKVIDIETHPLELDAASDLSTLLEEVSRNPALAGKSGKESGKKVKKKESNPNVQLDQPVPSGLSNGLPAIANLIGINWLLNRNRVSPLQMTLRGRSSRLSQPRIPEVEVHYNQTGTGNDFEQDVDFSSSNDRYITQVGIQNFAWQRLYNTTFSDMTIRSIGNFNRVSQTIYNGYHQNMRVVQNGSFNVVDQDIYSTNIRGAFERSSNIVRQIGRYNIARTLSYGASNNVKIMQNGNRNSTRVNQNGNNNSASITQVGSNNSVVIEQH